MSKKNSKPQQLQITNTEQAEYVSPGVETQEGMNAAEISKSLSPAKLASLVGESKKGNTLSLITLALEMREEDPSFGGNLRTRKLAVLHQPRTLAESKNAKANELIQKLLNKHYFNKLLFYLLEAIEVGFAVVRLVWGTTQEGYWLPVSVHRIDPRRVGFDPNTEQYYWRNFEDPDDRKNLIDGSGLEYIVYTPDDVMMPARGGLARLAAYAFMAKRFGLNDWIKFLSSAGMPVRVGKYEASASSEQRLILKRALQYLSADKAAAIPKNTDIQFVESQNQEGGSFKNLAEYLDKQIALAVLGQTLTSGTEGGGSYALGQVHDNVRLDIVRADCVSLSAEIRELVNKICLVNFGPDAAPQISIKAKVQKDLQKLANVVSSLSQAGAKIPLPWVYQEFGIPEPKEGEEVLGAVKESPQAKPERNKDEANSLLDELNAAAVSQATGDPDSELQDLEDEALGFDYKSVAENALLQALNSSKSFSQFQKKLAKIALQEPDNALVQALAVAATKGALQGASDA